MKKIIGILSCLYISQLYAQMPTNYPDAPPAPANINAIEYYYDNLVEIGNGTALTGFTAGPNVNGFTGNANVNLPMGFHRIYIRSKDANGVWSHTSNAFFDNYTVPLYNPAPAFVTNIVAIEYFIDTDPGFGNATPITFTPGTNLSNLNANINVTGLPQGIHRLYIRSQDAMGKWSLTNIGVFDNASAPNYPDASVPPTNIVAMEYFIDTDPGFGNATIIPITTGTNLPNINTNINVAGLPVGIHRLYIRSQDAMGKWSLTNLSVFDNSSVAAYPAAPPAAPPIEQMEYYIDTDPGFGNGTAITTPTNTGEISNLNVNITLSGNLSAGTHYLYIRSKQNPWSLTNVVPFTANSVLPLLWQYVKAQLVQNNGVISWATAQEINTKEFVIEHSTDGVNYTAIHTQAAAGNSSMGQHYTFTDNNITPGIHYYRIRQVDMDEHFTYSVVVTLLNKNNLKNIMLAPNPASSYTVLIMPKPAKDAQVNVYNAAGQIVLREKIADGTTVHQLKIANLSKGEYFVELINDKNKEIQKLLKQ